MSVSFSVICTCCTPNSASTAPLNATPARAGPSACSVFTGTTPFLTMKTQNMTSSVSEFNVTVVPHPFAAERVQRRFPEGTSLAALVTQCQPDSQLSRHTHIFLNGERITPEKWARVYPKKNAFVSIRMVPMGGCGGKNPLRTILSLAI